MGNIRKVLLFIVLLIGVSSSLVAIKPVRCDSITNPPAPEFTVKFLQEASNSAIVLTVTNQPINNPVNGEYYYHYYDVRWKNRSESENAWKWLYPDQVTQAVTLPYPRHQILNLPSYHISANIFSPNSQLDYQVQIIVATDVHVFSSQNFTDGQWKSKLLGKACGAPHKQ